MSLKVKSKEQKLAVFIERWQEREKRFDEVWIVCVKKTSKKSFVLGSDLLTWNIHLHTINKKKKNG